ncbi:MAG: hypothetical protein A2520_10755 [Deltaproteobacteria bacterium RIFOXYD12_FULL_53_23]|nr:MAG: hypothetical protein A2520_10755 [Deltaproteobacteria bacterium RIFOXYD12_FULL_53_23]
MPSPSIQCLTFTCKEISGQVICLDNLPIHLTFSPQRHVIAKQWLQKYLGATHITDNTDRHYFTDLIGEFLAGHHQNFPPQAKSPFVEKGSNFQRRVWDCIAEIPYGETKTYGELAKAIDHPGAARAVGQACNANPLALIVPCHRVIGSNGLGGFAGGDTIKKILLLLEQNTMRQKSSYQLKS